MKLAVIRNPVLESPLLGGGDNPTAEGANKGIGGLISGVIGAMLVVSFVIAIFYFMTGALSWITSGGDKAKLESAREKIVNALIGLIVVAATWAVAVLVGQFLGLEGFTKGSFMLPVYPLGGK
ncbi:hypothetical protein KKB64_00160 [Patescibacteria group bacterium]|nr:hypothetical protein [Patescibacteria group bacterium]MBU1472188.1 hypothetical protein [Patescibacteria group bacterium]MBU2459582.1 hypothetical protein [Patescibacteria group bacterium]MBU2544177.1 hypothetical protein [Patescibacteria group bacterium]